MITAAEIRQARSDMSTLTLSSERVDVTFAADVFLFRDFVEVVVTNVCDFRVRREKCHVRTLG